MTAGDARGSWLLDDAIAKRWDESGLDDVVIAYRERTSSLPPLCNTEARPDTPHPYVVYERLTPSVDGHSTGVVSNHQQQYQSISIQFRIHAKPATGKSETLVAREIAVAIRRYFDPEAEPLEMLPDKHIQTIPDGDYSLREGDDEEIIVLPYLIQVDATYRLSSETS
jgi:hypothetical protein